MIEDINHHSLNHLIHFKIMRGKKKQNITYIIHYYNQYDNSFIIIIIQSFILDLNIYQHLSTKQLQTLDSYKSFRTLTNYQYIINRRSLYTTSRRNKTTKLEIFS